MILGLAELLVVLLAPALMAAALFAQRRVPRPGELLVIYGRRSEGRGFAVQRRAAIVLPLVEAAELVSFTQLPLDVRPRVGMRDGKEVEFEVRAIVRRPEDPEQLGRMLELRIPVNVITQIVDRDRSDRRTVIGAKRRWGVRLLLGGLLLSPRGAL